MFAARFTDAFDAVLASGDRGREDPAAQPKRSAYAERWVCAAPSEVTDRMLITGPPHLRMVLHG